MVGAPEGYRFAAAGPNNVRQGSPGVVVIVLGNVERSRAARQTEFCRFAFLLLLIVSRHDKTPRLKKPGPCYPTCCPLVPRSLLSHRRCCARRAMRVWYMVRHKGRAARALWQSRQRLAVATFTMRAWPVARSIFDAPLCEGSERADNKLDNGNVRFSDLYSPNQVLIRTLRARLHSS